MTRAAGVSTLLLTSAAMVAFAANSLLCRMALGAHLIDAATFTAVRLVCGAVFLAALVVLSRPRPLHLPVDAIAVVALFGYAIAFSFAYLGLSAGTGALILFGAVQLTMISVGLVNHERLPLLGWTGLVLACVGLAALLAPGVTAPPLMNALLMAVAGIAWGVYSLRGRKAPDPLQATAANFVWSVPLALLSMLVLAHPSQASTRGIILAAASGAIASGLGYVIWYAALARLRSIAAASVQLSVPVIAAVGGVLFLGEHATLRLALSSFAVLGGIALVLRSRQISQPQPRQGL
jgi:drug/metabolite transporter (DMT)-like permease